MKDIRSIRSIVSKANEKKDLLHKREYVFIGRREGLAQLLDNEYRLMMIPEEIIPATLHEGSNLLITVELNKARSR